MVFEKQLHDMLSLKMKATLDTIFTFIMNYDRLSTTLWWNHVEVICQVNSRLLITTNRSDSHNDPFESGKAKTVGLLDKMEWKRATGRKRGQSSKLISIFQLSQDISQFSIPVEDETALLVTLQTLGETVEEYETLIKLRCPDLGNCSRIAKTNTNSKFFDLIQSLGSRNWCI